MNLSDFIYSRNRYKGDIQPENLVFNANLQEFAQKVSYISTLETAGKLRPEESFHRIESLWQELKTSKRKLKIGENPFAMGE